ncbi:MAG: hypothetical protein LBO69_00885 [Ignavibacteria bacterium]|jgi:hypothetical protein|nr:hypothetical protein [Ignavibacteria bacterium]
MFPTKRLRFERLDRYEWFEFYCKLGTTRTIDAVASHFKLEYRKVQRASERWYWIHRTVLYDEYQLRFNDNNRYAEIDRVREDLAQQMLGFANNLSAMFDRLTEALANISQSNDAATFEECAKVMQTAMKTYAEFKKSTVEDIENTVKSANEHFMDSEKRMADDTAAVLNDKELRELYFALMEKQAEKMCLWH